MYNQQVVASNIETAGFSGLFSTFGTVDELELDDALWEHLLERGTYAKREVALKEILQAFVGNPQFFPSSSPIGRAP